MQSVAVYYLNGEVRKGVTGDFLPNTNRFHLVPAHAPLGTQPHEVRVRDLKAIHFMKSGAGPGSRQPSGKADPVQGDAGRRVRVVFRDGEELVGSSRGLHPGCPGFYVIPLDARSNIDLCYVLGAAVKEIQPLPGAYADLVGDAPIRKAWMAAVSALRAWVPGLLVS